MSKPDGKLNIFKNNIGNEDIIDEQDDFENFDKEKYFIVKIAGKGNIKKDDPKYKKLQNDLIDTFIMSLNFIKEANIEEKEVLIIWDGDNYQGEDHQKPSPFTDLIKMLMFPHPLAPDGFQACAVKHKNKETNPWKGKHIKSWKFLDFKKFYSTEEPHIVVNKQCDMYVSFGSTAFQYRDPEKKKETSCYSQLMSFIKDNQLDTLYPKEGERDNGYTQIYIKKKKKKL